MDTQRNFKGTAQALTQPTFATSRNIAVLGIVLALVLCLGAWGAHAADPQPDNPYTSLRATAVDEAVVAVVADHAYVTVDGQVVTGTGFKAPIGKQLSFNVDAEDGFNVVDVSVVDIEGNSVALFQDGSAYTIAAEDVVDGLTIAVNAVFDNHVNAGLFEDDDDNQPALPDGQRIPVTVAVPDEEFDYNAEFQAPAPIVLDQEGNPLEGFFAMGMVPLVKDVTNGAVVLECTDATILDSEGNDVTNRFDITYQPGNVVVKPAVITIETPDGSKVYDGSALTAPEINLSAPGLEELFPVLDSIRPTGSQIEIGESPNTYSIDWGSVNPANYRIEERIGTLTVTANEVPIVIKALDATRAYNGMPLVGEDFDLAAPSGYRAEVTLAGSQTDVGSSTCEVAAYAIFDEAGNDVTATFSNIQTVPGTLTVEPAILSVATPSDNKVYDGKPLTAFSDEWINGFVNGETATCTITGSQTEVGSSPNTFQIVWDGTAKESNYRIDDTLGLLEVTSAEVPSATDTPQQPVQSALGTTTNGASQGVTGNTSTTVEETPNVVYVTSGAPAASASSTPAGSQTASSESASPLETAANVVEDALDVVTTGIMGEEAKDKKITEEILDDDATPLAGVEKADSPALTPWIIAGIVLLAVIGALLAILFGKRNKKDQAQQI